MVNMGEKLKSLRVAKKLTQKQVSDRIGVAISAVSSYEAGTRYPSYDVLIKLAKQLGITRSSVNAWEMGISIPSTQYIVELAHIFHVSTDYLMCMEDIRKIDVSGLNEDEINVISQMVDMLRKKY